MKGNNVTYTGKTWRKKSHWEDLGIEPPESPKFLHLPARQYKSDYSHNNYSYLPIEFHYYGMDKVKGGKGYKKDGTPIGIIGGPCIECDGTVINVQMNTSSRGMETTAEKVCDTCGLVQNGPFMVLGKIEQDYHTKPYDTHEEWIEQMKLLEERQGNPDDISLETEMFEHMTGHRPGDDTEIEIGGGFKDISYGNGEKNSKKLAQALKLNDWKSEHWGRDGSKDWKKQQQYNYLDICKTQLCMNSLQVMDVKYLIDKYGTQYFHRRSPYEDIIMAMCIHRLSKDMDGRRLSILTRTIAPEVSQAVLRHVARVMDGA